MKKNGTLVAGLVAFTWLASCHGARSAGAGHVLTLAVGVDDYRKESIPDLKFAGADAKLLSSSATELLHGDKPVVLTSDNTQENLQPNKANVIYWLDALCKQAKPDDTLVFFFAGHGVTLSGPNGGNCYLLTEEASNASEATLKSTALSAAEITETIKPSAAGKVIVLMDACRNDPSGKIQDAVLAPELYFPKTGRQSLTLFSCDVTQKSWEWADKEHGFFTYFLVNGLRESVGPDGNVTTAGLGEWVQGKVADATTKFAGGQQKPVWLCQGNWALASVPGAKSATAASGGNDAKYVSQIDTLSARLDKEMAQRKIAEEQAQREAARSHELEMRLSLLEKQSGAPAASAEVDKLKLQLDMTLNELVKVKKDLADTKGGGQANAQQLDSLKLATENQALKERVAMVEGQLKKDGSASRDIKLENSFQERRDALAKDLELQRLNQDFGKIVAAPTIEAKVAAIAPYKVGQSVLTEESQLLRDRLDYMERTYAPALAGKTSDEIVLYKDAVQLLKSQDNTLAVRIDAAKLAAEAARKREQEGTVVVALVDKPKDPQLLSEVTRLRSENDGLKVQVKDLGEKLRVANERIAELEEAFRVKHPSWRKVFATRGNIFRVTGRIKAYDFTNIPINGPDEATDGGGNFK